MLSLLARWYGTAIIADPTTAVLLGRKFLGEPTRTRLKREWRKSVIANDRLGIARAVLGVLTGGDMFNELDKVLIPTLILVGNQDGACPPKWVERIHSRQRGSRLMVI